ncbi:MAG: DUF4167 domain-containing protein [Alphaproteobacteria bacterium]|nr:DUF4167 domain-containing protein [Alphaproteobacteria bacterium]MBR3501616.1 DUF4167 domain-containing protein [Alphaproteobacteria bacterium]
MKKNNNNKFRGNNSVNSLNYKYDSVSFAGKISGTALDLIKRYNELAKEAQSNGNYVEMEVFRQYAEHYRKIVTDVNERKSNMVRANYQNQVNNAVSEAPVEENVQQVDNGLVETEAADPADNISASEQAVAENENVAENAVAEKPAKTLKITRKKAARSFTVVEVKEADSAETSTVDEIKDGKDAEVEKPKRRVLKRKTADSAKTVNE